MKLSNSSKTISSSLFSLLVFSLIVLVPSQVEAHWGRDDRYYGGSYRDDRDFSAYEQRVAFNNGYQLGYGHGANDRYYGRSYDVDRHKAYRDGDSGFRREFGDKDDYKRVFRNGFERGYRDGYDGYRRRVGGWNGDYCDSRDNRNDRAWGRQNNSRNRGRGNRPVIILPGRY